MSQFSQYRGQSVGRVLHALDIYCSNYCGIHDFVNSLQIGKEGVRYSGRYFATYKFIDGDIPDFIFFLDNLWNADTFTEQQFRRQPYLDRPEKIYNLDYTIQEVRRVLSFDDALCILFVRNNLNGDWNKCANLQQIANIELKVCDEIVLHNSHFTLNDAKEMWQHVAMCAIYEI